MRSQKRDTGRRQSLAVTVGSPKSSICCSTGSGWRLAKVSPGQQQHRQAVRVRERGGRHQVGGARARPRSCRPSCAGDRSPSRRRSPRAPSPARCARGTSAAPCDGPRAPRRCPRRCRGRRSRTRRGRAAGRRPAVRIFCAARYRTSAWAIVRRIVFIRALMPPPLPGASGARHRSCARSRRRCARSTVASSMLPANQSRAGAPKIVRPMAKPRHTGWRAATSNDCADLVLAGVEAEQQHAVAERVAGWRSRPRFRSHASAGCDSSFHQAGRMPR